MKKYYVNYTADFGNTYNLYYAENAEDEAALPTSAQRITRREALRLAAEESDRRRCDPAFSGYADIAIYPAAEAKAYRDDFGGLVDWYSSPNHKLVGRIWERI